MYECFQSLHPNKWIIKIINSVYGCCMYVYIYAIGTQPDTYNGNIVIPNRLYKMLEKT